MSGDGQRWQEDVVALHFLASLFLPQLELTIGATRPSLSCYRRRQGTVVAMFTLHSSAAPVRNDCELDYVR